MPQISYSCVEIPGETYSISVFSSHISIGNKTEDQRTKLAWLIQEQISEFLMHCFFLFIRIHTFQWHRSKNNGNQRRQMQVMLLFNTVT